MLTLFNVNEINFLNDNGDKDRLRFIPAKGIELNYTKWDLLQRIFTEDIIVNPDTPAPEYPAIIQQLIDANPQPTTAAQIAQILSLYNPSDISEIIRQLIDANPQPTTREEVAQNVYAYPYESNSAIYDYKFLNWTQIDTGDIIRNGDEYTFNYAGVQFNNIAPLLTTNGVKIEMTVNFKSPNNNVPLVIFYNTVDTTSTKYPYVALNYNISDNLFNLSARTTNNGSINHYYQTYAKVCDKKKDWNLTFFCNTDFSMRLNIFNEDNVFHDFVDDSTATTLNLKNIRICVNKAATTTASNNTTIKKLKISYINGDTISQWSK